MYERKLRINLYTVSDKIKDKCLFYLNNFCFYQNIKVLLRH